MLGEAVTQGYPALSLVCRLPPPCPAVCGGFCPAFCLTCGWLDRRSPGDRGLCSFEPLQPSGPGDGGPGGVPEQPPPPDELFELSRESSRSCRRGWLRVLRVARAQGGLRSRGWRARPSPSRGRPHPSLRRPARLAQKRSAARRLTWLAASPCVARLSALPSSPSTASGPSCQRAPVRTVRLALSPSVMPA